MMCNLHQYCGMCNIQSQYVSNKTTILCPKWRQYYFTPMTGPWPYSQEGVGVYASEYPNIYRNIIEDYNITCNDQMLVVEFI